MALTLAELRTAMTILGVPVPDLQNPHGDLGEADDIANVVGTYQSLRGMPLTLVVDDATEKAILLEIAFKQQPDTALAAGRAAIAAATK